MTTRMRVALIAAGCIISASAAIAQNNRTAVSIAGSDTATCTVPDPCRTFAVALSKTNSGGEVLALTSGGYGPFTIDRSATIVAAPGTYAALVGASGQNAIVVDPGSGGKVVIRGLTLTGFGVASAGVTVASSGSETHIENCVIDGFDYGVYAYLNVTVTDSTIRNCGTGFRLDNAGGLTKGNLERVVIKDIRGGRGVFAIRNAYVTVRNCSAIGNGSSTGFEADDGGQIFIENSIAARNSIGVLVSTDFSATGGIARISNCVITDNTTGVNVIMGTVETFSNNKIRGNGTAVSPSINSLTTVAQN